MSEREILLHWLAQAARRLRLNWLLREVGWLGCGLFTVAAVYETLSVVVGSPLVLAGLVPLFILCSVGVVLAFAVRLRSKPTLAQAARDADRRAGLKDQLKSAYWFVGHSNATPAVELLVRRASQTVLRLVPRELFPIAVPTNLLVAATLACVAGSLAWFSPRLAYSTAASPPGASVAGRDLPGLPARSQHTTRDQPPRVAAGGPLPTADRLRTDDRAWSQVEELTRALEHAPELAAIRAAVVNRDAKRVTQLLEAMQRRQAANPSGASARPEGEQMSAEVAQGILARLQDLLGGDEQLPDGAAQAGADLGRQPAARITQGPPPDSKDEQWSNNPGRHSEGETALNTLLRSLSRSSIGERQAVRAEGERWQEGGRSNVSGGAMGRRVGVSQAGAGDDDNAKANPAGDIASDPVLGQRTPRLEAQLQRVRVERGDAQDEAGTTEASYAPTQSQTSTLTYQSFEARQRASNEEAVRAGQTPLAYRAAVKTYFLTEHGKEQ